LDLKAALEKNKEPHSIAEKVALSSRHYAKRQITWFRHKEKPICIDGKNAKENLDKIIHRFQQITLFW
jgi:tRNA dimethylallyltransferase